MLLVPFHIGLHKDIFMCHANFTEVTCVMCLILYPVYKLYCVMVAIIILLFLLAYHMTAIFFQSLYFKE